MHNCATLFLDNIETRKQSLALEVNNETFTYEVLAKKSKQVFSVVEKFSKSKVVAVLSCKELLTYSAIIGVISSGRGYCPIGHKLPTKRQITVFKESSADTLILSKDQVSNSIELLKELNHFHPHITIITDKKVSENTVNKYPNLRFKNTDEVGPQKDLIVQPIAKDDLAYLLFTSGTTGKPKGVPITHENLTTYLNNIRKVWDFGTGLRFSQTFPLTFDLSIHDIFVCWMHGGCLIPIPEEKMISPAEFINSKQIQVWFSVPSQISLMNSFGLLKENSFPHIKLSLFCGEPLPVDLTQKWVLSAQHSTTFNLYGPTEATIAISAYQIPEDTSEIENFGGVVSIGKIFTDHQYEIVDDELILTGKQIASDYWGVNDISSSPFSGNGVERSYKTGDIVEERGGLLFYLSRLDNQVKINGNRIELEEINSLVRSLIPNAQVATVVINSNSRVALHTFVSTNQLFNSASILAHLKNELPAYMIPKSIHEIEALPLNQSGKVDSNELKAILFDAI